MHLEVRLMQCHNDVGGCDWWQGSWFEQGASPKVGHQWWIGWHSSNPLTGWQWPDDSWNLIGHELWHYGKRPNANYLMEALYVTPNPSLSPHGTDLTPTGYWHGAWDKYGRLIFSRRYPNQFLTEGPLLLKGASPAKGTGKGKSKGKGIAPGKGKGKGGEGEPKGKGKEPKGKGKGKGPKGSKGKEPKGKGKGEEEPEGNNSQEEEQA